MSRLPACPEPRSRRHESRALGPREARKVGSFSAYRCWGWNLAGCEPGARPGPAQARPKLRQSGRASVPPPGKLSTETARMVGNRFTRKVRRSDCNVDATRDNRPGSGGPLRTDPGRPASKPPAIHRLSAAPSPVRGAWGAMDPTSSTTGANGAEHAHPRRPHHYYGDDEH